MALRLVFCGTPEFALPSLRLLLNQKEFQVEAVVTQPDRPRGRGRQVQSSPVKDFAIDSGLYVYQPEKIRDESVEAFFKRMNPDAVVIIAYGQKIPPNLLEMPRLGWINLHGSLLPKYRGAAPINWAIVDGKTRTGLTTMRVEAGMDTGPILLQREIEIGPDETAPELSRRMSEAGAPLVIETLLGLEHGEISPRAQDNAEASKAPLLKKEMGRVDWKLPPEQIYNQIRGFEPWPGAFTTFRGQMCRVWGQTWRDLGGQEGVKGLFIPHGMEHKIDEPGLLLPIEDEVLVICGGRTWLKLDAVQLQGKKRVTATEFANGARLTAEDRFDS
jgi:methionyl-tRNA formyltransferase